MYHFISYWEKKKPTEKEFLAAATDMYRVVSGTALANGEEWTIKPTFICHLRIYVPLSRPRPKGEENMRFWDYLQRDFKKETGLDWDSKKYVAVEVPADFIGGPVHFAIFDKRKI